MNLDEEICALLDQMADLLFSANPENMWAKNLQKLARKETLQIDYLKDAVKSMYGGMGSLNDTYVCDANGKEDDKKQINFEEMKERLYSLATTSQNSFSVVFHRDSVCADDDCNAPNEYKVDVATVSNTVDILRKSIVSPYLPCFHQSRTFWIVSYKNAKIASVEHSCEGDECHISIIIDKIENPTGGEIFYFSCTGQERIFSMADKHKDDGQTILRKIYSALFK